MSESHDPRASTVAIVGVIGAIAIFVVIVFLQVLFLSTDQELKQDAVLKQQPAEYSQLKAEQLGRLHSYAWVDKKKGIVQVPIDVAMDLVVRDATTRPAGHP